MNVQTMRVPVIGVLLLCGSIELSSFCVITIGHFVEDRDKTINTEGNAIAFLHQLGLPKEYTPLGSPTNGAWQWAVLMSSSPAYNGYRWANEFWQHEHERYRSYNFEPSNIFQPNVIWRMKPRTGKYVEINAKGIRNTINTGPKHIRNIEKVFMFGGSSLLGTGVPDDFTIPSILSKYLNGSGSTFYEVTNFGTGSFILEQDMQLLFDEIRKGNIPDIAVFYHGANDSYAGVYSPGKPGWYLGSEELKTKLYSRKDALSARNETHWFQELHTYRLLSLLKSRILLPTLSNTNTASTISTSGDEYHVKDYGPKAKQFIAYYKETLKLISSVCENYGITVFFIWQPVLVYGEKLVDDFERSMIANPALLSIGTFREKDGEYQGEAMKTTYHLVEATSFEDIEQFHNLSHVFDRADEPLYIDWVHLGPRGNEIVARTILDIIHGTVGPKAAPVGR